MRNTILQILSIMPFLVPSVLAQEAPKVYRDAEQAFLERTSLLAANAKCQYFTDLERSALMAGQLQARGELLRSGVFTRDAIDTAAAEVELYANRAECGNEDFMAARAHLKSAFAAFIGTMVMDYPGLMGEWKTSRSRWDTWRSVQNGSTDAYLFQFGLLAPVLTDPDDFPANFARPLEAPLRTDPYDLALDLILTETQETPSAARLLIRHETKAPQPWLGNIFSGEPGPPPRGLTRVYWPIRQELIIDEEKNERRLRYFFPSDAIIALEKLDPREHFQIAVFPNMRSGSAETPDYLTMEIGDFAAAHAFTKLPPL